MSRTAGDARSPHPHWQEWDRPCGLLAEGYAAQTGAPPRKHRALDDDRNVECRRRYSCEATLGIARQPKHVVPTEGTPSEHRGRHGEYSLGLHSSRK